MEATPRNRRERRHPEEVPRLAYTPEEAAAAVHLSRARIYELIADGSLPSVKIGKSRRIRHDDLVALLDNNDAA